MSKQRQNFSPSEFMEKLAHDDFSPSLSLVLTGMVKTAEDENHLLFAYDFNCTNWIALPIEIIENIEWLYTVPCKDHTHPLVNIMIKEPTSEEAKMFATLARSLQSTGLRSPILGDERLEFQRMFRDPRFKQMLRDSRFAIDEYFPRPSPSPKFRSDHESWLACMDDGLKFAIEQDPDWFLWYVHLFYKICS